MMHLNRKRSDIDRIAGCVLRPPRKRRSRATADARFVIVSALLLSGLVFPGCARWGAPSEVAATQPVRADKTLITLAELTPPIAKPVNPPGSEVLDEDTRTAISEVEQLSIPGKPTRATDPLNVNKALKVLERAASQSPDHLKLHLGLGNIYASNKQTDRAVLAFRTALMCSDATPDNPLAADALLRLSLLLKNEGFHTAALESFTELSNRIDQYGRGFTEQTVLRELLLRPEQLLIWRGELLLKLTRFTEATALLEQAFSHDRTHHKGAPLLFEALLKAKDFARAESLLVEFTGEPTQRHRVAKLTASLCEVAREKAMPLRIARALAQREQLTTELAILLAKSAESLQAHHEAVEILRSFLQDRPGQVQVGRFLAKLYGAQGRHDEALRGLAEMLVHSDRAARIVRQGVQEVLTTSTPVDIDRTFALIASEDNTQAKFALYYVAGQLAEALHNKPFAAAQYRKALAEKRDFLPTYEALVDIYLGTNETDRLERLLKQVGEVDPESYFIPYLKGKVHFARKEFILAAVKLSRSRERNRNHIPTLVMLGRAYARLGQPDEAIRVLIAALTHAGGDEQIHRLLFEIYAGNAQYERARYFTRRLLKHNPNSVTGRLLEVRLALLQKRTDDARKAITELQNLVPDHEELPVLRIRFGLVQREGPLPEAEFKHVLKLLSELIVADPTKDAPKRTLAQLLERQGEQTDGVAVWRELYEQTNAQADIAKAYAAGLFHLERYQQATEVLRRAVTENPTDMIARRALIQTLVKLDKQDEAAQESLDAQEILDEWIISIGDERYTNTLRTEKLKLYLIGKLYDELTEFARKWTSEDPRNVGLRRLVVSLLAEAEQYDHGHRLLDEWITEDGPMQQAYRQMKAVLYIRGQQLEEATNFILAWIDSEPALILPRQLLVQTLVEAMEYERVQELLDGWIERSGIPAATTQATQPATPKAAADWSRKAVVELLRSRRKHEEALDRLELYIPLNPKDPELWVQKSSSLNELTRPAEAIAAMETAHALEPDDAGLKNNLGYMYADMGINLDQAERMIRTALAEEPTKIAYKDSLGWVFYKQGKFAEAGRIFEQILEAPETPKKNHPTIFDHAGDVMWRLGRKLKAIELWKRALELAKQTEQPAAEIQAVVAKVPWKIDSAASGEAPKVAPLGQGVEEMGDSP